jgi:WD40 repeat protein
MKIRLIPLVVFLVFIVVQVPAYTQGLLLADEIPGAQISWHPDGTMLAVSDDLTVQIIDATTRQPINNLSDFAELVTDVKWSPDGNKLAIATRFSVQVWEHPWSTVDAQLVLNIQIPIIISPEIDYGILAVDWHPDPAQNQLLGVTPPGVTVWDSNTGQTIQTFPPSPGELLSATWSPDGSKVALGEITGRIYVYSFMTQESEMAEVFDYSAIDSIAWKPDDTMIAAGTSSGRVQLLTLEPFLGGAGTLDMPTVNIVALDWNPIVGELLATGDTEGNLAIWSLSPRSRIVHETQQAGAVASVVWSPDGSQLAYSDAQGGVEIIPAPDISNEPPVADAGADQVVIAAADGIATVTLDGSGSYDPDGFIEGYIWGPEDSSFVTFGVNPTVTLDVGVHVITLIVTDDIGASDSDQVTITVE